MPLRHKDCGGKIMNNECKKCGQKFGLFSRLFSDKIEDKEDKYDHVKRLRSGRDLFPKK